MMARQFETEEEAKRAGYTKPNIREIDGFEVVHIDANLEQNSDYRWEWYFFVDTYASSYYVTEDGEVLDEFPIYDDASSNMPCDTYGMCGGPSCPNYYKCQH